MADIKFKFNAETEEVELLVNDKVAATVETEIFESWVAVYNEKHGYVKPAPEVVDTTASEDVTGTVVEETTESNSEE